MSGRHEASPPRPTREPQSRQVALVTGANKGLGLEIARQLGRQGINVVLDARDQGRADAAAKTLRSEGIDAHGLKLDVTDEADVAALPAYFESTFGRLDILVNNAGIALDPAGVTRETFRRTYETNTIAPWFVTQALLPLQTAVALALLPDDGPSGQFFHQGETLPW